MKNLILIFVSLLLFACKNNPTKKATDRAANNAAHGNQIAKPENAVHSDTSKSKKDSIAPKAKSANIKLIGFWVADGSENLTFEIREHTFYYPEHFASYQYKIVGDSVRIQYEDFSQSFAYQLEDENKLILVSAGGEKSIFTRKK